MSDSITPFQPTLPPEIRFTDAEFAYIDDSPERLFPENQDSNFGLVRRIFTDYVQELIEIQNMLYNERFVESSTNFLDEWEKQVGLPTNPVSKTVAQRREEVLLRIARGPFTRTKLHNTIERYIAATFGPPVELTSAGVPITSAGIPLYSEGGSIADMYHVIENIANFSYEIRLLNGISPDLVGLNRELSRITPAGISYSITSHDWPFHNYVANPSAEVNLTGWSGFASAGAPTLSRTAEGTAPAGANVFQIVGTATSTLLIFNSLVTRVRPGQRVWIMGYARVKTGTVSAVGIQIRWHKADGTYISEATVSQQLAPVTNTWYPFSAVITAPENARWAGLGVFGNVTGVATVQADKFMLYPLNDDESIPTVSNYIET